MRFGANAAKPKGIWRLEDGTDYVFAGLPKGIQATLRANGVSSTAALLACDAVRLLMMPQIGRRRLSIIKARLAKCSLSLAEKK